MDHQTTQYYCIFFHSNFCARKFTHTVPPTHFHTKLNGFQQLAYLLMTMRENLSNTVLHEMGLKNEKLLYKLQKF